MLRSISMVAALPDRSVVNTGLKADPRVANQSSADGVFAGGLVVGARRWQASSVGGRP